MRHGLFLPDHDPRWREHTGGAAHDGPEWSPAHVPEAQKLLAALDERGRSATRTFLLTLADKPGVLHSNDWFVARFPELFPSGRRSVSSCLRPLTALHEDIGLSFPFRWWKGSPSLYAMKRSAATAFVHASR